MFERYWDCKVAVLLLQEGPFVLNVWHKKPIFMRGGELLRCSRERACAKFSCRSLLSRLPFWTRTRLIES
jgi:hypothetical protein